MLQTVKNYFLEHKIIQLFSILLGLLPLGILSLYTYLVVYQNGTKATLNRRESVGRSIAKLAQERFDSLVAIGIHYASHPQFQKLIREKRWEEALSLMVKEQQPLDNTIDRILLIDPDSSPKADYPHLPEFEKFKGKQFKDRDWYKGVSRSWEPYVTEVFQRLTEPKINIISVVIPIKSILPEESGRILGILNLTMSLDNFYQWSKTLNSDTKSLLYFVDQSGHIAGHPNYSQNGDIVNYSTAPPVARILEGKEGVDVLYDPVEKKDYVSAYFKVGAYRWGVVLTQEATEAFRERDNQLGQLLVFFVILIIIASFVFYVLFSQIFLVHKYRFQERLLLESVGDGVFVVDKKFTILLWNKAAGRITGLTAREVTGKECCTVFSFVHGKTHRDQSHLIRESILKGETKNLDGNTVMALSNGRKIPIGYSAAPIFSRNGRVDGAIIVFHDMTAEHALARAKDEFLSIAAHQLRTPLGLMRWNIELLLKDAFGKISKETKTALEDMFANNLNLIKLVNDLLDVSRINQEKIINTPQLIDMMPFVRAAAKEREEEMRAKGITLSIQAPAGPLPKISADPELFRQLLRNLMSNAVKYNRDGGTIGITVTKEDKAFRVAISDSGIGIPKQQLTSVFDTFSRADNAIRLGIAGTGLGLFVVKSYVHLWGGTVWLESEEGKGTTVYVTIPYENHPRR